MGIVKHVFNFIITAFIVMFIIFLLYFTGADYLGKSGANSLCDSINVGDAYGSAKVKMQKSTGFIKSLSGDNHNIEVGFRAAGVEKYFCIVSSENGIVTKKKVSHED